MQTNIPQPEPRDNVPLLDKRWDEWTEAERLGFLKAFFNRADDITAQIAAR